MRIRQAVFSVTSWKMGKGVRSSLPAWCMAAVQAVGTGPMVPSAPPLVSLCNHKSLEKLL